MTKSFFSKICSARLWARAQDFSLGATRGAEKGVGFLGNPPPSHQLWGLGSAVSSPCRFGDPDRPKVFHCFQHLG